MFDHLQPWYTALNRKACLPTMLVAPDNEVVCESIDICEKLETITKGKKLMDFNEEQAKRYQKIKDLHHAWDVDVFSMGLAMQNYFVAKTFIPLYMTMEQKKIRQ